MEWLKDKKNLPIVVALAVFFLLGAGGLIAFELGAFSGDSSQATVAPAGLSPGGPRPISPPRMTPGVRGVPSAPSALPSTAAVVKTSNVLNPAVGPDPFYIPGGQKKIALARASIAGLKIPVRDMVGPLNLFQIRPPAPPVPPTLPDTINQVGEQNLAANYRLSGVITGSDGVNAILEVAGQSQSVKAGDTLPDGSKVEDIQTTSLTLQTAGGTVISLPLSAGNPDQGTTPYGQPPYYPGQSPFNGG